jgi:hypothetical protein
MSDGGKGSGRRAEDLEKVRSNWDMIDWGRKETTPINNDLRAFYEGGDERQQTRTPTTYFARNRNIVDECDILLVVPFRMEHSDSGGTWYTYDYAVKKDKMIKIFWPLSQPNEGVFV